MFRLNDWLCSNCNRKSEHVTQVTSGKPVPKVMRLDCKRCGQTAQHTRMLSLTAPYMGERVLNPMVSGGNYDTMGAKALPPLPIIPDDIPRDGVRDFFNAKEYKAAKRERHEAQKINLAKRARAKLIKQGANINMRRDRLPGDPNFNA